MGIEIPLLTHYTITLYINDFGLSILFIYNLTATKFKKVAYATFFLYISANLIDIIRRCLIYKIVKPV